ncbi:probable uridine nucleosidase 2 [Venturia canescens]|uniref:probable uridine nucleosidase 2 n=1 Tax=Venturia canescens TaxID=32260 RepID=UPI001C9CA242|nr:probable uridine nucleosidase 2 [Venturia canescens]
MKTCTGLSLVIGICLVVIATTSPSRKLKKLIIDTDAGGDDAAAILLALGFEKHSEMSNFEVVAITCTYGNTNLTNVATNVLKILTIANRSDIPVYAGAQKSMMKKFTKGNYFGEDGFGDFHFDEEIVARLNRSSHASLAMVDLARDHPGEVSVMAIGPLTNLALAMTLDSSFVKNVERFYLLGSSVRGWGNVAPNVEFNFSQDPQSNFIVLNGTDEKTAFLFPWEANLDAKIPMKWRRDVLGSMGSKTMKYLNKIERPTLNGPVWHVGDLALAALVVYPELISSTLVTNVTPVFDGSAEGSVLVDYANTTNKPQNVEILLSFDVPKFQNFLLDIFSRD